MQPSDTAYPRFKSKPSASELGKFYTPSEEEQLFSSQVTRTNWRLGFVVLLKTYQRLGYFVSSDKVPRVISEHIANALGEECDTEKLREYDCSQARRKHLATIRDFLEVKPFDDAGKAVLSQALLDAAQTKEDVIDMINVGIETLVRYRYELPAFYTLEREARSARSCANQSLYNKVYLQLSDNDRAALDKLFVVGNNARRVSPWNDLKQDSAKSTVSGMKVLLDRYDWLTQLGEKATLLKTIPLVKVNQWALEGISLDAASMVDMAYAKRYVVTLAVIRQRLARITDDLCDIFCKQMRKALKKAEEALEEYLEDNQEKTDEILRRFSQLDTVLNSAQSPDEQIKQIHKAVTTRPDLCEFSKIHAEHGGKNECRFIYPYFKPRRANLLAILKKLTLTATNQNDSFERSLNFMLAQSNLYREWIDLDEKEGLGKSDLNWVPEKWWKLVTGESTGLAEVTRINRQQFEVCTCLQMVKELKSGDICVIGSDHYSDYRDELVPLGECERTRAAYGEEVGLPVEKHSFVEHLKTMLTKAAQKADDTYKGNVYFKIVDGRPQLMRKTAKTPPDGYQQLDNALRDKLNKLNLSVLDVLSDTINWIEWGKYFNPLSGHQGKLQDEEKRKILTVFAYGTGLGPTQVAQNVADISDRQVAFVNQRQVTTEKLEAAITLAINAYNQFQLPKYWGDSKRAAADGTQWDLYENNLLSESHIRYGGYGGIAYYHVSDTYIALFSHFIPCGVWEAVYILDGLTKNQSDIQPDTLHGDTQAQSAPVYGLAFLLGIKLMPRIRGWKDLKWYRPSSNHSYKHIDELFTKDPIDWDLIARHYEDMMQVAQSIRAGRISPSTILRKLGTASRKNKLYYAFRELGRVVRTVFLLGYIGDHELREVIHAAQNKCEGFNNFAQWVYFGSDTIEENDRDNQLKIIKYNHLVANLIIFHNCHTMTKAFKEIEAEGLKLTPELLAAFSPFRTHHLNRFGRYELKKRDHEKIDYGVTFNLANG